MADFASKFTRIENLQIDRSYSKYTFLEQDKPVECKLLRSTSTTKTAPSGYGIDPCP